MSTLFTACRALPLSGMVSRAAMARMAERFNSSCFSYSCLTELAFALDCTVDLRGSISLSMPGVWVYVCVYVCVCVCVCACVCWVEVCKKSHISIWCVVATLTVPWSAILPNQHSLRRSHDKQFTQPLQRPPLPISTIRLNLQMLLTAVQLVRSLLYSYNNTAVLYLYLDSYFTLLRVIYMYRLSYAIKN